MGFPFERATPLSSPGDRWFHTAASPWPRPEFAALRQRAAPDAAPAGGTRLYRILGHCRATMAVCPPRAGEELETMAMRLISATDRPLAALALLSLLSACATTASEPSSKPHPAGWRIVERTGEARYSPPDSATWMAAITGQVLAGGSEIATGRGGRLIVDAPGRHLTVGPESRFVLPDGERDPWLDQRAGWLRYRIAEAGKQSFRIQTRSLEVELSSGVVDVHVDH